MKDDICTVGHRDLENPKNDFSVTVVGHSDMAGNDDLMIRAAIQLIRACDIKHFEGNEVFTRFMELTLNWTKQPKCYMGDFK